MTCSSPVIININNGERKCFTNVNEITVGRNKNCSFDIPDPTISREQCNITLSEDNNWIIKDLSRHKSTILNGKRILDKQLVIKNGDIFSFQGYQLGSYAFFYSKEDAGKKYNKRKCSREDAPQASKVLRMDIDDINKTLQVDKQETALPKCDDVQGTCETNNIKSVLEELEKYKSLYLNAVEDLKNESKALMDERKIKETAMAELTKERKDKEYVRFKLISFTEELKQVQAKAAEKNSNYALLKKEKELLEEKLQNKESIQAMMLLQIQELTECLKESEQEQIRLSNESQQSKHENGKKYIGHDQNKTEKEDNGEGKDIGVTPEEIENIVGLIEVQCTAQEIKQLNQEVLKKDDKITDLVHELEKHKQDLMETIDREMLCTICSEVIYFAITLNCKHTFCKACIGEWKKKKKECPICRTKIKSEVHPLAIDSFIDRLFDVLGGELKSRREAVKLDRSRSALEVPSTSRGFVRHRHLLEPVNRAHRRSRRNMPTMSSAMSILHQPLHLPPAALPLPAALSPQVIIDLTVSGNRHYLNL